MHVFADRASAGIALAERLLPFAGSHTVVLALPRGGVPVAYEIAQTLRAPLDVFLVRKLGVPGREELAAGAIASGGVQVLNDDTIRALRLDAETIAAVADRERLELKRRELLYRGEKGALDVRGKTVILVDDGIATGASMLAAIVALRALGPESIVVAAPVAPPDTIEQLRRHADAVIYAASPEPFGGVGAWYEDFHQVSDEEVRKMLA